MAKKKVGAKKKRGDTASDKGKKKKYSEDSHAKDEDVLKGKNTKSNLADEGSVVTGRYSTRRGGTVDEKDEEDTSGAKNIGKNEAVGKRKHSEMIKTPAKRKVDQQKAEASVSSNEKSSYSFRQNRAITCFRNVDLHESEYEGVVGKRVKVFRSESRRWCTGRIESYNRKKKQHKVVYNDDKNGELDMKTHRFELEVKPGEAYNFKEGSSAGKGKSVLVEDDETQENESKLNKENTSSGPVEKTIKLGKPIVTRDAKERVSKSQKKGSATDEKKGSSTDAGSDAKTISRKTKKAGEETNVESRRNLVRKTRTNVRTR